MLLIQSFIVLSYWSKVLLFCPTDPKFYLGQAPAFKSQSLEIFWAWNFLC